MYEGSLQLKDTDRKEEREKDKRLKDYSWDLNSRYNRAYYSTLRYLTFLTAKGTIYRTY